MERRDKIIKKHMRASEMRDAEFAATYAYGSRGILPMFVSDKGDKEKHKYLKELISQKRENHDQVAFNRAYKEQRARTLADITERLNDGAFSFYINKYFESPAWLAALILTTRRYALKHKILAVTLIIIASSIISGLLVHLVDNNNQQTALSGLSKSYNEQGVSSQNQDVDYLTKEIGCSIVGGCKLVLDCSQLVNPSDVSYCNEQKDLLHSEHALGY